jgi:DNA-binding CsgD family transcriptional regulator
LLTGLSLAVCEVGKAAPKLSRAVNAFATGEVSTAEELRWGWLATVAANTVWDLENWHVISHRQLQSAREAGLLAYLPMNLTAVGMVGTWRGDFAMAGSVIAEADAVAEATGARHARYAAALLAGFRGREAEASALIEVETRNALATGQGMGMTYCQWVSGILYNGLARYDKALAETRRASEVRPELGLCAWARIELIEAAARSGENRLAAETLERLVDAATVGKTDWGLGVLARSRALLNDGAAAEDSYREAIERLSRTQLRPELARAQLVYGEWLRREDRRVEARTQLRVAHELFRWIGMEAFAERARRELQATGEHVRAHTAETRDDLTAQERQIAELARDGLTNPEIGARLFLSPRTVEWHLRHVFTKLGVRSRRELFKALPNSDPVLGSD